MKQLVFHVARRHTRGAVRGNPFLCPAVRALTEKFGRSVSVSFVVSEDGWPGRRLGHPSNRLLADIATYDRGGRAPAGTYRVHLSEYGSDVVKAYRK